MGCACVGSIVVVWVVGFVTIAVHMSDGLTGWEGCTSRGSDAIIVILCCLLLVGVLGRDFAVGGTWGRIGLWVFFAAVVDKQSKAVWKVGHGSML